MIGSQNAVLNQYAPTFCIDKPVGNEVLVYDADKKAWVNRVAPDLDYESFVGLEDTPINYSGAAGYILAVDPTEQGVTFISELDGGDYGSGAQPITPPNFTLEGTTVSTFTSLVDTPITYSGTANFILQVNDTETGVFFASFIDGGSF